MELLLSANDQQRVIEAIKVAETNTSGEIRVHVEQHCPDDNVLDRAVYVFQKLAMHTTAQRNSVLFYVAVADRKLGILGDVGINNRVPAGFWNNVFDIVREQFAKGQFAEGLSRGILQAGKQLQTFFPYQKNDVNELPDDISFGDKNF